MTKQLRLIELFAGYGSQALALRYLNIPFEHHFICEFDKYAVQSYNEIHGTNFTTSDIRNVHAEDLNITETDKYNYLLTYSFPCTDLSTAGRQAWREIAELLQACCGKWKDSCQNVKHFPSFC